MKVKTSVHLTSKLPPEVEATQKSRSIVPRSGQPLVKLPYIILENHISKKEALYLLGRIVRNVRKPLQHYVPSGGASFNTLQTSTPITPNASDSTPNSGLIVTAQDTYPEYDPALFVLPKLPLSVSESTSVTLSERRNYSS